MIKEGDKLKITGFDCGHRAMSRFVAMGIRIGEEITVKVIQPDGPYVVDVGNSEYSIGRGMFGKLIYERITE